MKSVSHTVHRWAAVVLFAAGGVRASAADAPLEVNVETDRQTVLVADPVWLTVTASGPTGWSAQFPQTPDAYGELKVRAAMTHTHTSPAGRRTATMRLQLESLSPGRYTVGPLEVSFIKAANPDDADVDVSAVQRSTDPVTIHVRSALGFAEGGRLRAIYGTVRTPWSWRQWTAAAAGLVAALAIGWAAHRGVARWRPSRRNSQRSLLQQLDRLDEARLSRTVSNERFVVSIADVVRQSLQLADGARPVHRTTDEWIRRLQGDRRRLAEPVGTVLRCADAVKFAGQAATLDHARRCLEAARRVVGAALGDHLTHTAGDGRS